MKNTVANLSSMFLNGKNNITKLMKQLQLSLVFQIQVLFINGKRSKIQEILLLQIKSEDGQD